MTSLAWTLPPCKTQSGSHYIALQFTMSGASHQMSKESLIIHTLHHRVCCCLSVACQVAMSQFGKNQSKHSLLCVHREGAGSHGALITIAIKSVEV